MAANRAAQKSATRTRIVQAAYIKFEMAGYEAATMRDIAALAGLSTGAIFASFAGKAELLDAVLDAWSTNPVTRGLTALRWLGRAADAEAMAVSLGLADAA